MNFRQAVKTVVPAVLIARGFVSAPAAQAAYVIDLTQVGVNVVANGSGTLNFLGQNFQDFLTPLAIGINPSIGYIAVGDSDTYGDIYTPISGPGSFGTGGFTAASSTSGTVAGVSGASGYNIVPGAYYSGTPLTPSITIFDNATFASLGLKSGTYVYTLGSGANTDFFTVDVNGSVGGVPEPSTWAMMLFGFGGLGFLGYCKSRKGDAAASMAV